jgi:hypothetical protein
MLVCKPNQSQCYIIINMCVMIFSQNVIVLITFFKKKKNLKHIHIRIWKDKMNSFSFFLKDVKFP